MSSIHPTAIIEDGADIADDAFIGPYCVVGPKVKLASGVRLESHVVVTGNTSIGENSHLHPFASIGFPPQDMKFDGEDTKLIIGKNNIIREHVTMNPGTAVGRGQTVVGDNGLFMVGSHVAHDCIVGDSTVFANNATLGGHVTVGDYVMLGGLAAIHQHTRIGRNAFIGGVSAVVADVIPFGSVYGVQANLAGLNIIGMKRRGFSRELIHDLRSAYRLLFAWEGTFQERIDDVTEQFRDSEQVMEIIEFIRAHSSRPICLPNFDPMIKRT